jgi:putative transposase
LKKKTDEGKRQIPLRTMKIRIKDRRFIAHAKEKLYSTKHFENMLLILLHLDQKENNGKNSSLLLNSSVMRAALLENEGGKNKENVIKLQESYRDHQLFKEMKAVVKGLKIHNVVETIKEIKKNQKSFWTKVKQGDQKAKQQKPKKLSKLTHFTLHTDSYKSFSLKKKNKIGLNLNTKMYYTHVRHDALEKVVGKLENIRNVRVHLSNDRLYLEFVYEKEPKEKIAEHLQVKVAGLDIGVNILAALWIEDPQTSSLLIDGKRLKQYNATYNRMRAKLTSSLDTGKHEHRKQQLFQFRRFLTEQRKNYFHTLFHQYAKRILEYCSLHGVTKLVVSDNLSELKNNGNAKMRKENKQPFIHIPFLQLLKQLKDKASSYNIEIECVNEAYTSLTSSVSGNIFDMQERGWKGESLSTNDFKGSRVKRGLYQDKPTKILVHADLNGARNIGFLGGSFRSKVDLKKYRNPLKITSDIAFCQMTRAGIG